MKVEEYEDYDEDFPAAGRARRQNPPLSLPSQDEALLRQGQAAALEKPRVVPRKFRRKLLWNDI